MVSVCSSSVQQQTTRVKVLRHGPVEYSEGYTEIFYGCISIGPVRRARRCAPRVNPSLPIQRHTKQIPAVRLINPLTPKDPYSGRTAPLTSKSCILYIYSTNTVTEYFKHGIYCPFFSSKCSLFHNSNVFYSCFIHILYAVCAKINKKK